jgi:RNA polymerase sigma factor (sigma-70 family)
MMGTRDKVGREFRFDVLGQLPSLRRYARALTRCSIDAEDLVHDALVRAYERRASFRAGHEIRVWLLSILHNVFVDGTRAHSAEAQRLARMGQLVEPQLPPAQDHHALWRHGDEEDVKREHAVESLVQMLKGLVAASKKKNMKLAPFIGVGCPGIIEADGSIDRGAQHLPGNWEDSTWPSACTRPFPRSEKTKRPSSCTTTRLFRA